MIKILSDQRALQKGKKRISAFLAKLFSFLLLLCFAYVVLYPFLFKILASFMSYDDIFDESVALIPKHWVLDTYKKVFGTDGFLSGMLNTAGISFMVALLSTASAAFSGYGLARFRFPGHKALIVYVIFTMMLPLEIISISMYSTFRYFDIFGIVNLITGSGIQLTGNPISLAILAVTSLSFRGGIFVYLLRQYYKDIPSELTEAAYVDGAGVFKTFFSIALPMSRSMLIVVFALSFAWQWTDTFYSGMLISDVTYLTRVVTVLNNITLGADRYYNEIIANTAAIVAVLPLIILYLFLQKRIIQGIERSGIVG